MKFSPRNKYIYVKELEEQKVEEENVSGFILPPTYKQQFSPLKVVEVIRAANDTKDIHEGQKILVAVNMIESLNYKDMTITIVPEHAIYGVLWNDE